MVVNDLIISNTPVPICFVPLSTIAISSAFSMAVATETILLVLLFIVFYPSRAQEYPFKNISLPFEDRVKDLVNRLTLDEIVSQMSRGGALLNGPAPAIPRLGIKPYQWGTECLSGDVIAGPATSFPQAIGMASSFSYDMVYKVARAISDEVRSKNNYYVSVGDYGFHKGLSCWSPVLNILRDPRWGRNQETYGEDPWLSGYLGKAYVKGLQGGHPRYLEANAGCKHFDVHGGPENIPVSRFSFNAQVSEQDWRMTFLPQFKACVDAGSWSLMCSYNSINGVPACANNQLLTDVLRKEWDFKGYIVSDQGAIENIKDFHHYTNSSVNTAAAAVNAGVSLEDANLPVNVFTHLGDAVLKGLVSESTMRNAVSPLFMVRMRLGEFDPPEMNPYTKLNMSDYIQSKGHIQLAHDMAVQSMVLLKNDPNNSLPITAPYKKACVVGPFIDTKHLLFGDYAPTIMEEYVVTPLKAISSSGKLASSIVAEPGCFDGPSCKIYTSSKVKQACEGVDVAIACLGTGSELEREGHDRSDINLPGNQLQLLKDVSTVANSTIVVLYNAGPLDVSWAVNSNKVVAIIESFFPAQTGGSALVDVLVGNASPAGRLPNTWPASIDQVPDITNYTMVNRTYRYFEGEPLFPFGYGLSYTTFKYSNLTISPSVVKAGQNVSIEVVVENTGSRLSDEVIQVYISWSNTPNAPIRQLVGVRRQSAIPPAKAIDVKFTITADQMMLYDQKWYIPLTQYTVFVGGQQPEQKIFVPSNVLKGSFTVQQDDAST